MSKLNKCKKCNSSDHMQEIIGYKNKYKIDGNWVDANPVYNTRYRVCFVCELELKADPGDDLYMFVSEEEEDFSEKAAT